MQKLFSLLVLGLIISACGSSGHQKTSKIQPNDTCYTEIVFENIYSGEYPSPTVTATVFKITFDSLHVGEEKNFHQRDSVYWVGYTFLVHDPKDSTRRTALKSKINHLQDSVITTYYKINPENVLQDYNHRHPVTPVFPKH